MTRVATLRFLLCELFICLLAIGSSQVSAVDVLWEENIDNNYANPDNWSTGFRPAFFLDEIGVIGNSTVNNGVANVSSLVLDEAAGITLGQGVGTSGTLNIQNNGVLTVKPGNLTSGVIRVGNSGVGTLNLFSGGTLNAEGMIVAGGNGSQLNASGTAVSNINANFTVAGSMQITGPSVNISVGGDVSLVSTSTFIPEITGGTHSTIDVTGTVTLDGSLEIDFSGYSPTAGESWDLFDASIINGNFSSVTSPGFTLGPGESLVINKVADVSSTNGFVARLALEVAPSMLLEVNPITGEALLFNDSDQTPVDIQGYDIFSPSASLLPNDGDWESLDDQDVAGGDWRESNVSTVRLAELKEAGATTFGINGSTTFDLGMLFNSPTGTRDLEFQFLRAGDSLPTPGTVVYHIPGDFDGDLDVDRDDLTDPVLGWEARYGIDLDGLDFLVWQKNFGLNAPLTVAISSVPEPTACLLFVASLSCLAIKGTVRHSSSPRVN